MGQVHRTIPAGLAPPLTTLASFATILGTAVLLGTGEGDSELARSVPWTVWKLCGGVAVALFLVILGFGVRVLRRPEGWGLRTSTGQVVPYLLSIGVVLAAVFVWKSLNWNYDAELDPIPDVQTRTNALLFAAFCATAPLVTVVWLVHQECLRLRDAVADRPPHDTLAQLLRLWRLLITSLAAFAAGVATALITAGALRAAQLAAHPTEQDRFPATNVLFYGAFFALVLTTLALPMVVTWRARAYQLVNHMLPLPEDGLPTESWLADRSRLQKTLHLDTGIIANPLTALTVFTPLVTSLLAAFIPQLGGSG